MNKLIIPIIVAVILAAGIGIYFVSQKPNVEKITNFEECVKAGYPVLEIYPRQCKTPDGRKFTEKKDSSIPPPKSDPSPTPQPTPSSTISPVSTSTATQTKGASSISFVKKIEIPDGARPEIVATDDRVFVFYLQPGIDDQKFIAKVFDKHMANEITTKVLVTSDTKYGKPTDIRLASDGKHIYAFYETSNSYLFGAKYALNDDLDRAAYTSEPITKGSSIFRASEGDEIVDDPAPFFGLNSVYVATRIKSSLNKDNSNTILRVREMDLNLNVLRKFDIDLSDYIDGETQQNSLIYHSGYYYLAIPSITEDGENLPYHLVSSEIVMVKFDKDWNVKSFNSISSKNGYSEGSVMGVRADAQNFYLIYVRTKMPDQELLINLYDDSLDLLKEEIVKSASFPSDPKEMRGEPLRPSIWLHEDKLYIGNNEGKNAGVYIYKIIKI